MTMIAFVFAALVQEQVDNPEFKYWRSFKPGSSVTHKGGPQQVEQKTTLKSVGDEEITVETEMSMGGKTVGKAMERRISAKVATADAPKMLKEGEEEIEAGGRKLKCRWTEYDKKLPGGVLAKLKVWIHEDVPGGAVKVQVTMESAGKNEMIATAWEKK